MAGDEDAPVCRNRLSGSVTSGVMPASRYIRQKNLDESLDMAGLAVRFGAGLLLLLERRKFFRNGQ